MKGKYVFRGGTRSDARLQGPAQINSFLQTTTRGVGSVDGRHGCGPKTSFDSRVSPFVVRNAVSRIFVFRAELDVQLMPL